MFIIVTPEILPISGLFQVVLVKVLFSQTFGNQGDGIVAIRIFYGAVSGAGDAVGDIAEFQVGDQSTTSFRFMAVAGADGCILQLGLQTEFVVYSFQSYNACIGFYDFSIRTALGTTIAVTATGVGHVAVSFVDVDK